MIYLFKVVNNNIETTTTNNNLNEVITSLNKDPDIKIYSQDVSEEYKNLILDSFNFAITYCKEQNLNTIDCCLNTNYKSDAIIDFISIVMQYNNFDYKIILSKFNLSYTWRIILKNKKTYKINLCLIDDFKHLIQVIKNENIDNSNLLLKENK